jgi:hypothetical protein
MNTSDPAKAELPRLIGALAAKSMSNFWPKIVSPGLGTGL